MNHKRAEIAGQKFILYIGYSFLMTFSLIALVATISSISDRSNLVPENLEVRLLIERVFSSPECFAYQDFSGRAYDIIDFRKFNDDTLNNCIFIDHFPYDFLFELELFEGFEIENGDEDIFIAKTQDWRGIDFEERFPQFVLVKHENKILPGRMIITRRISSRLYT